MKPAQPALTEIDQQRATRPELQARYGLTPRGQRTNRVFATIAGIGVALVLLAWLWWAGLGQPTAVLETRDLGYTTIDERTIAVKFDVSVEPGTPVSCAVQALNASYGIVGWLIVDLPASDRRTRVFEQPLRTSEPAVTGLLYECWLP